MESFAGLPKDFFVFFRELAENNTKDWFEANKPRYQQSVVTPASALIVAMAPRLAKVSKHIVADPRPNGGSMFRIYRDVRFSKDKRPYKEHAGIHFRHAEGKTAHAPGYYVHLAPSEVFFGGGVWMPEPDALQKIRRAIADDEPGWKRATGGEAFRTHFRDVEGESLVRPPKGFDPSHPRIELLKKKSFYVMVKGTPTLAQRADFLDGIDQAFRAAKPFMAFLCKAVGAPF